MKYNFSNDEMAAELKAAILFRDYPNAIPTIAEIMGLRPRTIYDYLEGNIKISLAFLHAAFVATNGDPDVKKFLCPAGWDIVPIGAAAPTSDVEKEMSDIYLAAAELQVEIRAARADGKISPNERARIEQCMTNVRKQMEEVRSLLAPSDSNVIKIAATGK